MQQEHIIIIGLLLVILCMSMKTCKCQKEGFDMYGRHDSALYRDTVSPSNF
uniref:Uncharacterized protein n=1 Tax=viral metagenome TaxID=1070528 RepID=A0A6C0HEG2_9ZZZZ